MGMTIDNCIKDLLIQREDFTYELGSEEIDFMIETMRKYQKIEQIVKAWKADVDIDSYDSMADIGEVVEDGNVD
jgi:hypothetical protein